MIQFTLLFCNHGRLTECNSNWGLDFSITQRPETKSVATGRDDPFHPVLPDVPCFPSLIKQLRGIIANIVSRLHSFHSDQLAEIKRKKIWNCINFLFIAFIILINRARVWEKQSRKCYC